ncbi:MAG TPA: hypothetical protein VGK89_08925 [Candidatus Eisenbacteria bacterium]
MIRARESGPAGAARGAWRGAALALALLGAPVPRARAAVPVPVPPAQRAHLDAERSGFHDAANIRTVYWNFGMVGDYPSDPGSVDLSVFHSVEVPKGSGMNYSDGITPFVLAKVPTVDRPDSVFIMETGYRERQAVSPRFNRVMRFEPRPGYFEPDPRKNVARAPAISNDRRTWPSYWPDRLDDLVDQGWPGSWNGYFGKRAAADQESYSVMDDDFYDAWLFTPDSRDSSRRGLGLRVEVRGFQWANPQAGNVIFWHYDITNEGTTNYDDNIIFGLYMDSGVGGSRRSCDGIYESDDDNAYFDKSAGLNLVYTWDRAGTGYDRNSNCSRTGYLGYAYLETPGNPFDGLDNDDDGIVDERRDGGAGDQILGQTAIRAYVTQHYDLAKFERAYGPLEQHAPYRLGSWWTGDEDMDWNPEFNDVGADGLPGTHDAGESDGRPSPGEPNFDRTDLNESDQIGLTGFKMNRIRAGEGNQDPTVDGILFYTDAQGWPGRLYQKFTDPYAPARFDSALAANYNIGFLFASGPFKLQAGQSERFSLALAYGADLAELRSTVATVQLIYNANYQFAEPPPIPTLTAEAGDHFVRLSWDDVAERGVDPVTGQVDFEGYRIYRSTDPEFGDLETITTGRGTDIGLRKPFRVFDLADTVRGYSRKAVEGVQYYLGENSGITHTFTDTTVVDGQVYYYAVTAYDFGVDSPVDNLRVFPSENPITVTRTPRGGLILPQNAVEALPNPRVLGFRGATLEAPLHVAGDGIGTVGVNVVNSNLISEGHRFRIEFAAPAESVRATRYALIDSTTQDTCFQRGKDFFATGRGSVGCGLLPLVTTIDSVRVWDDSTGFVAGSLTTMKLAVDYQNANLSERNLRRDAYPADLRIDFANTTQDTSIASRCGANGCLTPAKPAKFKVFALTASGERPLDFIFLDPNNDGTLSGAGGSSGERIDVLIPRTGIRAPDSLVTWRITIRTTGTPPKAGDVWRLRLQKPLGQGDAFSFDTHARRVDPVAAKQQFVTPYVVPNPYVEAASFEPARFNVSGRGERRMEFRALPAGCTIRIYTVRGQLVQTLRHDGSDGGFVAWNLRTKDNLDVAPGLYVFQVEAPGIGTTVGKFGVIK